MCLTVDDYGNFFFAIRWSENDFSGKEQTIFSRLHVKREFLLCYIWKYKKVET